LNQTDDSFTGSAIGGTLTCSAGGETLSEPLGNGTVVNGSVSGNGVSFDFGTADWRHQGTVTGSSMNGSVTVTVQLDDQVVIMNGTWAGSRQTSSSSVLSSDGPPGVSRAISEVPVNGDAAWRGVLRRLHR
jgi:hypothetical protein